MFTQLLLFGLAEAVGVEDVERTGEVNGGLLVLLENMNSSGEPLLGSGLIWPLEIVSPGCSLECGLEGSNNNNDDVLGWKRR